MKLMTLTLGSTSPIKMAAVREACFQLGYTVDLSGLEVSSGQNEQPVGFEEILRGAITRAEGAHEAFIKSFGVGIENGLLRADGVSIDIAVVVVITPDGRRFYATSSGVRFPEEVVEMTANRGFDQVTVGQVMHEDPSYLGLVAAEPHSWLVGQKISRTHVLVEGIRMAFLQIPGL